MSIEETHDWAKKVRQEFEQRAAEVPDLGALNKELTQGGDHTVAPVQFVQVDRPSFRGEVGKVDGDLFFHFFPPQNEQHADLIGTDGENYLWSFRPYFKEALAESFLEVFKHEDKLCWDFVEEMQSWVVRCSGYGDNIMANQLATRLFDSLQKRLEQ